MLIVSVFFVKKGVKIYSITEKRIITFIAKDHDVMLRDEIYRCSLLWLDENTLVIGWADRFKICKVVRRHHAGLVMMSDVGTASGTNSSGMSGGALRKGSSKVLGATLGALGATGIGSNFVNSRDKKDLGTHVEISKGFIRRFASFLFFWVLLHRQLVYTIFKLRL